MSTELYRERKAKREAEKEEGRGEPSRATLAARPARRWGLRRGVLRVLLAEAEAAVKSCRRCLTTAMPGEIYLEAGRGHLCPACAALTPRQRAGRPG
jgi:hypothetical protein